MLLLVNLVPAGTGMLRYRKAEPVTEKLRTETVDEATMIVKSNELETEIACY